MPPHWPQRVCSAPPAELVVVGAAAVVEVEVCTGGVVVTVAKVLLLWGGLPVALAASTDEMEDHAGFLLKLLSKMRASPSPGNVSGIQLYLSVKDQTVTPMQPSTSRQEPTTLAKSLPWVARADDEAGSDECRMSSSV